VPFVLAGEGVEASMFEEKPGFVRARAEQVLAASPKRVAAPCPYFQGCGGCHYQHTSYENQLEIKSQILQETLQRTAKIEWKQEVQLLPSQPWNYRNRTRMKMQHAPFALVYYRFNSRELFPAETCPISSPLINKAIAAIWKLGRAETLDNSIAEIEFFANANDDELLLEIYLSSKGNDSVLEKVAAAFFKSLKTGLPELTVVAAFFQGPAAQSFGYEGADALQYRTNIAEFRVSAGSFFQVNRFLIDDLAKIATAGASGGLAWDLYAGVGLFSLPLSRRFSKVTAVEAGRAAGDLRQNAEVEVVAEQTEVFLAKARAAPDFVLADPPRAWLGKKVTDRLTELHPREVAIVACDPATLARDLAALQPAFEIERITLVDLFPQTYHLETIVHLRAR